MAKPRQSSLKIVACMPWQIGIMPGLIGYVAIRHETGWYFGFIDNP